MREKHYIQNLMEGHGDVGVRQELIARQEALQQRHHHLLVPVLHLCQVKGRPPHSHRRVLWPVRVGQLGYSPVEQELRQSGASHLRDVPLRKHSGENISSGAPLVGGQGDCSAIAPQSWSHSKKTRDSASAKMSSALSLVLFIWKELLYIQTYSQT